MPTASPRRCGRPSTKRERRRERQAEYNRQHGITPLSIVKPVADVMEGARASPGPAGRGRAGARAALVAMPRNLAESGREIARLEELMYRHARNLEFEQAAAIRDQIEVLRKFELELGEAETAAAAR